MASAANLRNKTPIIVAGPTGVGKTAFAVELANRLDGEILGADAYQVYRGMEILTAQPDHESRSAVPHHLIGFLSPAEPFDAAHFVTLAREKISKILARGKLPIITGGSGLYIKALTHGLVDRPPGSSSLRSELAELSTHQLRERLGKLDPDAKVDIHNPRRVVRALEISILTGRPASELHRDWQTKATPGFRGLLLVRERAELSARIAENVRGMFERGVVAEVGRIPELGPTAAMAIGLREIQALRRGELSQSECVDAVTLSTRRYVKRQLTWFRNQFMFEIIDLTGLRDTHEIPPRALEFLGAA
ncbi:MAG TPA: tRNA (adenosine(37)-N6)-dimethylallyltransferase MiaA [Terrimicrobiaceae bacterium]